MSGPILCLPINAVKRLHQSGHVILKFRKQGIVYLDDLRRFCTIVEQIIVIFERICLKAKKAEIHLFYKTVYWLQINWFLEDRFWTVSKRTRANPILSRIQIINSHCLHQAILSIVLKLHCVQAPLHPLVAKICVFAAKREKKNIKNNWLLKTEGHSSYQIGKIMTICGTYFVTPNLE